MSAPAAVAGGAGHSATRIFAVSAIISVLAVVVAWFYGGWTAAGLTLILGVLEITLSFDNAVVNAKVLERMSERWQQIFLTVGIVIAVFGMRLVFPLLVVGITAHLNPAEAVRLAFAKGPLSDPNSYASLLQAAHPQIAAFGGMFLLLLALDWFFEDREITWLSWLERPLARIGKLDQLSVIIAGIALYIVAELTAEKPGTVLAAGVLGIITYLAVNGLGGLFENYEEHQEEEFQERARSGPSQLAKAAGKAGFFLFLYLEVLDASFSFDGVIGAFAITPDPIIIALGLGLIGALFVRSLTVFLVRKGTLNDYVYLEHGAHWAIAALAVILLVSISVHVDEVVTGLIGLVLIVAAFASSVVRNRRIRAADPDADLVSTGS
ncbi:DUF475 domain-containing protein [Nakamurella endophytica]|uniref:DUF475 domain-containing protein n=1 Tax=Nakamurella endophytica TaxID=1748367 RepID=A0A917SMN0_9ACTN|nr:DUF475 domain-containing protein [Nakamurella endophytica]GGL89457.1 hypothetical protein GCM10011594_06330 [Nakamurella endophytica]